MVAGECPFDGETQVDIFRRIMATPRVVAYPPTIAADAVSFVQQLLVGAPSKRLGDGLGSGAAVQTHAFISAYGTDALLSDELQPPSSCAEPGVTADALGAPDRPKRAPTDSEGSSSTSDECDEEGGGDKACATTPDCCPEGTELPCWDDFEPYSDPSDNFCGFEWAGPTPIVR